MDFAKKIEKLGLNTSKFLKLTDLDVGVEVKVSAFQILTSQYGRQLAAVTEENSYIVLPKRMCEAVETEEQLGILTRTFAGLVFLGVNGKTHICKLVYRDLNQMLE